MALDPETLDQLLDTIRRFVRDELVPREALIAREDRIPSTIVQSMRDLGLFGLTVPEAYGGLGLNTEEECRAVMELGWTSPAFRSVIGTMSLDEALLLEANYFGLLSGTADMKEGTAAFLEKRKAVFRGV